MKLVEIFLIAFSLGIDAFAVSISLSIFLKNPDKGQRFRIFFHFGLFQFLFPVVGYYLIEFFHIHPGKFGQLVAGFLLIFLGIKMFAEGLKEKEEVFEEKKDLTRGIALILFSSGVSIDALSAGVSMALAGKGIWFLAIASGFLTSAMSFIGISYGRFIGVKFSRYSEFLGGLILCLIGLKIGFFQ